MNCVRGYFREANLFRANLSGGNFSSGEFYCANFSQADLDGTIFRDGNVSSVTFAECSLDGTDFSKAEMYDTVFASVDLSKAKGLDKAVITGPLSIGVDTIYLSHNQIPAKFLRRAGIPETMLTYLQSLIVTPIQYNSCFISYSTADKEFAQRLYTDLEAHEVRCWFAPEDLRTGDPLRTTIDRSIHVHERLLLILSQHSIHSQWVEHEVETALDKERRQGNRPVLFPIRIDDAVMHVDEGWARYIRNTRHIGDFEQWKDYDEYQKALNKLVHDLEV